MQQNSPDMVRLNAKSTAMYRHLIGQTAGYTVVAIVNDPGQSQVMIDQGQVDVPLAISSWP
jgi:hypothetical protein